MDNDSGGDTNAWSFTNLDTAPIDSEHSNPNASSATPGNYFGEEHDHASAIDRVFNTQTCFTQDLPDDDMKDDASGVSHSQYSDDANSQDGDAIKVEEDEDTFPTIGKERYNIDLTGDEPLVELRPERVADPIDGSKVEEIIELSDGEDDHETNAADQTECAASAKIKTEPGLSPNPVSRNDTNANENVNTAAARESPARYGNEPSNSNNEQLIRTDDPNVIDLEVLPAIVKEEQGTPPLLWERELGKDTIDLTEPFGGLRPRPRGPDQERFSRMQQQLMKSYICRRPAPGGASMIFNNQNDAQDDTSKQPTLDDDGFEWMSHVIIPPDDSDGYDFHELERIYKTKRKHRKNTLQDDVNFKRAQNKYIQRHKRAAYEADLSDDSQAEKTDGEEEGPSISSMAKISGLGKRAYCKYAEDDDTERALAETLNPSNKELKQSKTPKDDALLAAKQREKEWRKERREELYHNMMAGIEAILLRDQMRREKKATDEPEERANTGSKRSRNKKKKARNVQLEVKTNKRTKTGRLSNVRSLTTSNVYNDSNANLHKEVLPTVSEKKKKDFLTSLVAQILPEDPDVAKKIQQDRIDIGKATTMLGPRMVKPDGKGSWSVKGMRSSLYHYQVQGSASMKAREESTDEFPKGGLLCDEMGLGKTIQVITTMVAHRQRELDRPKCTLVVCAPALLHQWEAEIKKHSDYQKVLRRIVRHHGSNHFSGTDAESDMERADVILTTYGEVVKSYPHCLLPKDLEGKDEKHARWKLHWENSRGLLHRAFFYRVVLDEAHCIKNHNSQTSVACRALMARHRWAVSGTPIHNCLEEIFPYFKFLRVKNTGTMAIFKENFCRRDKQTLERLVSMISLFMIRRTHADEVLGRPLYKLPRNTQVTIRLRFNKLEQDLYNLVRWHCVRALNRRAAEVNLEHDPKFVIMMFQRLRQMVAHIFQVQEVLERLLDKEYLDFQQDLLTQESLQSEDDLQQAMIDGIRRMLQEKEERRELSEETETSRSSGDGDADGQKKPKASLLPARFAKVLKELKRSSNWKELKASTLCQYCDGIPDEPYVTSCFHIFCRECLVNLHHEAVDKGLDKAECTNCGHRYTETAPCGHLKELEVPDLSASVFQDNTKSKPVKKQFKLSMRYVDHDDKLVLSTKILAVKKQLAKWMEEDSNAQIIVFSEWHTVMHLVGRICQQEKWACCHYNGKMSQRLREQALNEFADKQSKIRIMIASLKAGGTAFCRVHRIGQEKETFITRFMVEGTIDERLMELQEVKQEEIDSAIDNRNILAHISMEELLSLFGTVKRDENDRPFIMIDDEAMMNTIGVPQLQET